MQKISIRSDENGRTRLIINGVDMSRRCSKVVLEKVGGKFPQITVTMSCDDLDVEIERANVEVKKSTVPAATETVDKIKE